MNIKYSLYIYHCLIEQHPYLHKKSCLEICFRHILHHYHDYKICTVFHDNKAPRCFIKDITIFMCTATKFNGIFYFNFNCTIFVVGEFNDISTWKRKCFL